MFDLDLLLSSPQRSLPRNSRLKLLRPRTGTLVGALFELPRRPILDRGMSAAQVVPAFHPRKDLRSRCVSRAKVMSIRHFAFQSREEALSWLVEASGVALRVIGTAVATLAVGSIPLLNYSGGR
jgi:hypothetical protein